MSPALNINVFTAPEKAMVGERVRPFGPLPAFDPSTSTLIVGANDAVLIDTLTTVAEAEALANWGCTAPSQPNYDLYYPRPFRSLCRAERAAATVSRSAGNRHSEVGGADAQAIPSDTVVAQALARAIAGQDCAARSLRQGCLYPEGPRVAHLEQARTDAVDTTSLHVPSLDLVVGGDVFYNQCHMYVGDTTAECRANWIAAPDRLAALNPKIAVAGHKKPGAPDTPAAIEASKRYLTDFGRLKETKSSDRDLYDAMTQLYPDWVSQQAWLMFGFTA
jgi:hypothetical protein